MTLTKQEIKERNIRKYYILIDGYNDDKIARCETIEDVINEARKYDQEIDGGEWDPVCVLWDRDTKSGTYFDDWSY